MWRQMRGFLFFWCTFLTLEGAVIHEREEEEEEVVVVEEEEYPHQCELQTTSANCSLKLSLSFFTQHHVPALLEAVWDIKPHFGPPGGLEQSRDASQT